MTAPAATGDLKTLIPDLREIPLDQLAGLGGTPLAHAVALYLKRLRETGTPVSAFSSSISAR